MAAFWHWPASHERRQAMRTRRALPTRGYHMLSTGVLASTATSPAPYRPASATWWSCSPSSNTAWRAAWSRWHLSYNGRRK